MTDQASAFEPDADSQTSPKATPKTLRHRVARAIHRYDNQHALSGNDIPSKHHYGEADFVLAELRSELDALAALRAVARGYCPECGRGDAAPTVEDWEQQKLRADQAEQRLRNIANGHPRADAIQAEIGEMIAQTHELREQLRLVDAMRQQNLDAAAAATQRAETAERDAGIYLNRLTRLTDGYAEQFRRLEAAEAALERVRALHEQWVKAGPPPLGTPVSRWWDTRLVELGQALNPAADG